MDCKILGKNNDIALIKPDAVISDASAATDAVMTAKYESGCSKFIFEKSCFSNEFFILSSGIAGEILQKFINYRIKAAIVGDYSKYTSKPLKDFIYESNNGKDFFFVATIDEAVEKLNNL